MRFAWALMAWLLAIAPIVQAQTPMGEPVSIGPQVILRIRFPAGGLTAQQRAEIIQRRLNAIVERSVPPRAARVRLVNGQPVILLNGTSLVTVDANHARANHTSAYRLAQDWARNLDKVIKERFPLAPGERRIPFTPVSQTQQGGIRNRNFRVFTSREQWRQFWPQTVPGPVDFRRNIAIGVFMGQKPTAGYGVAVQKIEQLRDHVVITLKLTEPGPGAIAAQVITTPQHVVIASREAFSLKRNLRFIFVDGEGLVLKEIRGVSL